MEKYCSNCGKKLNEGENVCSNCQNQNNDVASKTDKNALIGFILGLVSVVSWIIPIFGYSTGICGLVFSIKGMNSEVNRGKAIAGFVLCIVFLVFSLINSIIGVIINLNSYYYL